MVGRIALNLSPTIKGALEEVSLWILINGVFPSLTIEATLPLPVSRIVMSGLASEDLILAFAGDRNSANERELKLGEILPLPPSIPPSPRTAVLLPPARTPMLAPPPGVPVGFICSL